MGDNLSDLKRALQGLRQSSPILALMSDDDRLPDPVPAAYRLPAGSIVIARSRSQGALRDMVQRLQPICRRRHLTLLVANDTRLALAFGVDGVHLSQAALARTPRRPATAHPDWIVSVAAHDGAALLRADRAGADLVLLSPVFPTRSHPGAGTLGPVRFTGMVTRSALPVLALGGIDQRTARRLRHSGAAGVAGVGFGAD